MVRKVWSVLGCAALVALTFTTASGQPPEGAGPPPSGKLEMTGDIGDHVPGVVDDPVHDPTLFKDGRTYYVMSTGVLDAEDPGGIHVRRSTGSLAGPWESLGAIALPEWTLDYDVEHLWAPHV